MKYKTREQVSALFHDLIKLDTKSLDADKFLVLISMIQRFQESQVAMEQELDALFDHYRCTVLMVQDKHESTIVTHKLFRLNLLMSQFEQNNKKCNT